MGEGGTIALINGTPYRWKRTSLGDYQMEAWGFPESIEPGTRSSTYVEYKQTTFTTRSDTQGWVSYQLEGTDCNFSLHSRDDPSNIYVELSNIETTNNPRGSQIQLGWNHDGIMYFILSGKVGRFHSTNPARDWMQQYRSVFGTRPLSQICMVGTHDSGMSSITRKHELADAISEYILCQSRNVAGQLELGARYFDIRPQISDGDFWTGHYTGKLGGRGESIASIITGINNFLVNNHELVIINFSHSLQSDTDDWRDFNEDEWHRLMSKLKGLKNLFICNDSSKNNDLSLLPLNDFIGDGRGAVICVIENESLNLAHFANQGFYKPSQLNVYNEYSNQDKPDLMVNDQLAKMRKHMSSGSKTLFLLSWTLTQQIPDTGKDVATTVASVISFLLPIKTRAYVCNKMLMERLLPEVGKQAFPNIIYIDYLDSNIYAALAMAINDRVFNQ